MNHAVWCKKTNCCRKLNITHSKRPKYDCEEVPKRHFQVEKSVFVKNPDEHLKTSANQIFVTYALSY